MKVALRLLALLLLSPPAVAQELPASPPGDARVRTVTYDPNVVIPLAVSSNYQLTVLFAPGEVVGSVALGDSGSWEVTASKGGDSLFVKPLGSGSTTNMTVITDARVYSFELTPSYGAPSLYLLRFWYPPASQVAVPVPAIAARDYRIRGSRLLRNLVIRDDGARTYMQLPAQLPIPAVSTVTAAGEEQLLQGQMRDGVFTLDGVYSNLIIRLNKERATAARQ